MFFKAIGLPTRAFEVLHQAGFCMSQRWSDHAIKRLSNDAMMEVEHLLAEYAAFFSGDNINVHSRVFSTRANNRNQCESGTAVTAFITPRPPLSVETAVQFRKNIAAPRYITPKDLISPQATRRLHELHVHQVIRVLLNSTYFATYPDELKSNPVLQPPLPYRQAPKGPKNKMNAFMLRTMKIDQASLDGNEQWLNEVLKQTGQLATPESQKELASFRVIPIIGDELTQSRLRTLKRLKAEDDNGLERMEYVVDTIGWFHAQMCLAQEIFQFHGGDVDGVGLTRDASMLQRKHFCPKRQARSDKKKGKMSSRPEAAPVEIPPSGVKLEDEASVPTDELEAPPPAATKPKAPKKKKASPNPTGKDAAKFRFHDLDELIQHAVEARILACWMKKVGLTETSDLGEWDPRPQEIRRIAEEIVREFASLEALPHGELPKKPSTSEPNEPPPDSEDSEGSQRTIFENGVRCLRDGLIYCLLRSSIRTGDVGTIEDLIPLLAIMFKGGNHPKYTTVMLETLQQLKYEYPPELAYVPLVTWCESACAYQQTPKATSFGTTAGW